MARVTLWFTLTLAVFIPAISSLGDPSIVRLLNLAFIVGAAACLFEVLSVTGLRRAPRLSISSTFFLGAAYIATQLVALLRAAMSEDPTIAGMTTRGLTFIAMGAVALIAWRFIRTGTFAAVMHLLAAYCLCNLVLWIAGITNASLDVGATSERASLASFFGFEMQRVLFPMAWGVNNFGVIAGAVIAFGITHTQSRNERVSLLKRFADSGLFIAVPLICCVFSDSRAAIVFGVAAGVSAVIAPRLSVWGMVAFWSIAAAIVLGADVFGDLTFAGRQGQTTFSGRELIWASSLSELAQFKTEHVFGYGAYGQFWSGVSTLYSTLFIGWTDTPEYISVHNSYLQCIFDSGYIGVSVLVLFLLSSIRRLGRNANDDGGMRTHTRSALAVMTFLATQGLTEVTLSLYQPWIFLILLALMLEMPGNGALRRPTAYESSVDR